MRSSIMNRHVLAFAVITVLGCSQRGPAPAALPPPVAPEMARLPLGERLAREASSRPAAALQAERVQQALAGKGIALSRWKQVLASPVGARYCMAGLTGSGLPLSVCEYGDPAAAERGLAGSRTRFDRLVPGRLLVRNGATLLTVTRPGDAPAFRAEAERLSGIFRAL
jgi:hypothetical protein